MTGEEAKLNHVLALLSRTVCLVSESFEEKKRISCIVVMESGVRWDKRNSHIGASPNKKETHIGRRNIQSDTEITVGRNNMLLPMRIIVGYS